MLVKPRFGVSMRQYKTDAQIPTVAASVTLLALAAGAILTAPNLRSRSGASTLAGDLPLGIAGLLGLTSDTSLDSTVGHLNATFFSLVLPIALVALTLPLAAASIARLAERNELEFLGGQALDHSQLVVERFLAVMLAAVQAAIPATLLIVVATQIGDFDVSVLAVLLAAARALSIVALITALTAASSALLKRTAASLAFGVGVAIVAFGLIGLSSSTAVASPARLALTATATGGGSPLGLVIVGGLSLVVIYAAGHRFEQLDLV